MSKKLPEALAQGTEQTNTQIPSEVELWLIGIVKRAMMELRAEAPQHLSDEAACVVSEINSKIYITVPEAQLLLGCSDDLLYKHIREARNRKAKRPIPYLDIGIYIFHRETLLRWAHGENQ